VKQVVDTIKKDYPDNQIKVLVDTDNFCLKIAKRPTSEGQNKNRWDYYKHAIPLPPEALNVDARKVPEGFKFNMTIRRNSEVDKSASERDNSPPTIMETGSSSPPSFKKKNKNKNCYESGEPPPWCLAHLTHPLAVANTGTDSCRYRTFLLL
jgi:hypothetical protein